MKPAPLSLQPGSAAAPRKERRQPIMIKADHSHSPMKTGGASANDAPHVFDHSMLRDYDIRGIVGQPLSAADSWARGRAFGILARRRGATAVAAIGRASGRESVCKYS